jgi:hypothetical protein
MEKPGRIPLRAGLKCCSITFTPSSRYSDNLAGGAELFMPKKVAHRQHSDII